MFLANAMPQMVSGMMGHAFQSPIAKPYGEGLSSSSELDFNLVEHNSSHIAPLPFSNPHSHPLFISASEWRGEGLANVRGEAKSG